MNEVTNAADSAPAPVPIIVFGETLVDDFGDGREVVGGAPLNVAWNLRSIGCQPHFVSAVGEDESGQRIVESLERWGLATTFVQLDPNHPTGRVSVQQVNGEPSYHIPTDQAFDFIRYPDALDGTLNTAGAPILYHGSLCARSSASRTTLLALRQRFESRIAVDINLRDGHYDAHLIKQMIDGTTLLKCNHSELEYLTGKHLASREEAFDAAYEFIQGSTITELWVTDGGHGAFVLDRNGQHCAADASPVDEEQLVDTVGAGDAFMAAVLFGQSVGQTLENTLDLAIRMSANACKLSGATTADASHYEGLRSWV